MSAREIEQITDAAGFAAATQVSRETIERLTLYEALLRAWQPRINLVADATLAHIWHRHFSDSAQLLPLIPSRASTLIDLGSGAGFPGMVLAIMLADGHNRPQSPPAERLRVTLIESDRRKSAFLREVARQTGTSVEILSTRAENHETQAKAGVADVVTARAVAPLVQLLGLAAPYFGTATVGLFPKGRGVAVELEAAKSDWAFEASLVPSVSAVDASVVVVSHLRQR